MRRLVDPLSAAFADVAFRRFGVDRPGQRATMRVLGRRSGRRVKHDVPTSASSLERHHAVWQWDRTPRGGPLVPARLWRMDVDQSFADRQDHGLGAIVNAELMV